MFDAKNNNQIDINKIKLGENQLIVPKYNEKIHYQDNIKRNIQAIRKDKIRQVVVNL